MGAIYEALVELKENYAPEHYPETPTERAQMQRPLLFWRLGLGRLAGRVIAVLTVTGRSTGQPRRTPITPHKVGGRTYVWCPYGGRSQWYRNLVANPVATLQHRGTHVVRAVGVEDDDEVLAVVAELRRFDAPWLRRYLHANGVDDTPEDILRNKHRLHLRRLDPTSEPGPPALEADLVWAWLWLVPVALAGSAVWWRRRRRF